MYYKRKKGKSKTKYIEYESYYKGYMNNGGEFLIDKEDYDLVKEITWNLDNCGYVSSLVNGKRVQQHRLIMGCKHKDGLQIDHINRNKIDNRKSNLRTVSQKENQRNKDAMNTSKTGIRGVCYEKERNKWRVQINTDEGRKRFRCNTLEEAIKLREKLEREYWNEN